MDNNKNITRHYFIRLMLESTHGQFNFFLYNTNICGEKNRHFYVSMCVRFFFVDFTCNRQKVLCQAQKYDSIFAMNFASITLMLRHSCWYREKNQIRSAHFQYYWNVYVYTNKHKLCTNSFVRYVTLSKCTVSLNASNIQIKVRIYAIWCAIVVVIVDHSITFSRDSKWILKRISRDRQTERGNKAKMQKLRCTKERRRKIKIMKQTKKTSEKHAHTTQINRTTIQWS